MYSTTLNSFVATALRFFVSLYVLETQILIKEFYAEERMWNESSNLLHLYAQIWQLSMAEVAHVWATVNLMKSATSSD